MMQKANIKKANNNAVALGCYHDKICKKKSSSEHAHRDHEEHVGFLALAGFFALSALFARLFGARSAAGFLCCFG